MSTNDSANNSTPESEAGPAKRERKARERAKNAYYTAVAPARGHASGPTAPAKIARVEAARIAYEAAKARCRGGPVLEAPSEA